MYTCFAVPNITNNDPLKYLNSAKIILPNLPPYSMVDHGLGPLVNLTGFKDLLSQQLSDTIATHLGKI